jgi:hypothetical protein
MLRHYKKHYEKKKDIKDFLTRMRKLNEELRAIKDEQKVLKEKKVKHVEDRNESNKTIEENKR